MQGESEKLPAISVLVGRDWRWMHQGTNLAGESIEPPLSLRE
jgi:hypothetical protein